jgi:16S rRNA (guanine966-N2)-methyltransferase
LRIVAGLYRGRALVAPPGLATRPTSNQARQAMFNVLEHAAWSPGLKGARVIDLFAGSGALGLEALSRGAGFCLFVETDPAARSAIRDNLEALAPDGALFGRSRIHRRDATDLGRKPAGDGAPFDLAFLDPPYGGTLGERALASLARDGWLQHGAICIFERGAGEPDPIAPAFEALDARRYGAARVHMLRYSPGAA